MEIYEDIYLRRNETPLWWYNKSSDLHASAGILWLAINNEVNQDSISSLGFYDGFSMQVACWPIYKMLCGLSLELAFKAIMVAAGESADYEHNLVKLAKSAKLSYSEKEFDILKIFTESIIWDGKYPVPKNKEHLEAHYKHSSKVLNIPINTPEKVKLLRTDHTSLYWDNYLVIKKIAIDEFFRVASE